MAGSTLESTSTSVGDALRAIADERRRAILELVRDEARSVVDIAAEFEVSRPAISQHLAVLADAGLVSVTRQGTRRLYRARPAGLASLRDYLDNFWTERLAALKDAAESDQAAAPPASDEEEPS